MSPQDFVYGTATPLNKNQYSRNGYDFIGWSTHVADTEVGTITTKLGPNPEDLFVETLTDEAPLKYGGKYG